MEACLKGAIEEHESMEYVWDLRNGKGRGSREARKNVAKVVMMYRC